MIAPVLRARDGPLFYPSLQTTVCKQMFVNREQATDEGSVMDVVQADAQIDAFIEKRSRQSTEQRLEEVMYAESVRRYHSRRRKEIAALWFAHFCRMAENHARISEDYERRAEELCQEGAA